MSGAGRYRIDPQPSAPPHQNPDIKSTEAEPSRRDTYLSTKLEIGSGREHQQFSAHQETVCFDLGLSIDGAPIITDEYVARQADLSVLEDYFLDSAKDGKRKIFIVHGLGGMGKTQLALGFAQRFKDRFSSIFFLDGTSTATISRSFAIILDRIWDSWSLSLSRRESRPPTKPTAPDAICQTVLKWFSIPKNRNWLIIYDNIDPVPGEGGTEQTINVSEFVPADNNGSIIVTTRSKSLSSQIGLGQTYELGKMSDVEATELLEKRIRPSSLPSYQDAVMSSSISQGVNQALFDLLKTLDGLPLALAQAGAYINDTGIGVREFVNLYERSRADLFDNLPAAENRESDPKASIWTTWKVSLDVLEHCTFGNASKQRLYQNSATLLLLFGYLDSRDIWFDLLEGGLLDTDAPAWFREVFRSEQTFLQSMDVLREYSFVTADHVKGTYSMHNLLHEYCLHEAVERKRKDLLKLAVSIIGYSCPSQYFPDMWKIQQRLLPHVDSLLAQLKGDTTFNVPGLDWRSMSPELEALASRRLLIQGIHYPPYHTIHPVLQLANVLLRERRVDEAVTLLKTRMNQLEQSLSRQHLMTLVLMKDLAWAYYQAGDGDKGKPLADEAYEGLKLVLGTEHRDTLSSAMTVSACESQVGNLSTALELCKEIYATSSRVLGPDDTSTIRALSNLAIAESKLGELAEAEVHHREAYYRFEKLLGSGHHATLDCIANLASHLQENKKYTDSELYKLKVLRGFMILFGPDGPATLSQAREIAEDYETLSKGDEAQKLLRDMVDAIREAAPRNTTSLADALDALSMVYLRQGHKSKAKQYLIEAYQAIIIPDRKNQRRYIDVKCIIGIHLHTVGEELLARELLESSLLTRESHFDPQNQRMVMGILYPLAEVYESMEDEKSLLSILDKLDSICITAEDEDIYDAMCSLGNTALKCQKFRMTEKVLEIFVKAAEFFTARDGAESYHAAISNIQIANYWQELQDLEKAKEYFSKLAEVLDKSDGPAHRLALDALCSLGAIEESEGNWESAEPKFLRALEYYREDPQGNDAPLTAFELANIYLRRGRVCEAEELLKESLSTMDWSRSDQPGLRIRAIISSNLGYIAREQGRFEDAITLWQEALPVFAGVDKEIVLRRLSPTLAFLNRFDDAFENFYRLYQYLRTDEKTMSVASEDIAMCLSTICICKHDIKEARSWLSCISENIRQSGDNDRNTPGRLREARLRLFELSLDLIELQLSQFHEADAGSTETNHGLPPGWQLQLNRENGWVLSLLDPDGMDLLKRIQPSVSWKDLPPLSPQASGSQASSDSQEDSNNVLEDDVETIRAHFLLGRSNELLEGWQKILQDIPEDLREDLKFNQRQTGNSWTYIPRPSSKATRIPLSIAGAAVIIPVRSCYPLIGPVGCPPDPHLIRINPASPLTDDLIKDIFSTYDFAKGFFILLNGMLQIMVNAKFDYDKALKGYPIEFGGLSVSYVPMSMVPTAESSTSQSSTVTAGLESATSSSPIGFLSRLSLRHSNPSISSPFTLSTNDTLEARVHTIGVNRGRHQGRVGLRIQIQDKLFLTMSTHVIHSARNSSLDFSKLTFGRKHRESALESSWRDYVSVYAQNKLIGKVAETFDPDAKEYPDGYMHDLCLIEPTDPVNFEGVQSPVPDLGWLSEGGWNQLRQNPLNLEILGRPDPTTEEQTTYPVPSDLCIVGEGVVRQKHGRFRGPLGQAMLAERNAYASIMSRCVLYRVFPNFSNPLGYSGIVLYCIGEREGGGGTGPAVVGFQSFYQPSDAIQHAEMTRAAFDVRMSEGSISFYGAFQVPDRVRKTHGIL